MRKCFLLIILFITLGFPQPSSYAINPGKTNQKPFIRDFRTDFEQARDLMNNNQFSDALTILLRLLKDDQDNCNLNFLIGFCYVQTNQKTAAFPYLEKSVLNSISDYNDNSYKERSAPVFSFFYLGQVLQWSNKFEEALINYEKFKDFLITKTGKLINQKNFDVLNEANKRIEQISVAKKLLSNPLKVQFVKVPYVNAGTYSSYSAQLNSECNLLFLTREKLSERAKGKSDIYEMKRNSNTWTRAELLPGSINSLYNDKFSCLSVDGKFLLFSSDRKGSYNIFYALQDGNKWTDPYDNLSINTAYNETYASISRDGSKLFFVSDRPGGFGGKDIYKIEKRLDGSWTEAENLGFLINTPLNEDTPWISDDGNTLYFSSQGHATMGGYDIFSSSFKNNMWIDPENIGIPINSPADELYFKKNEKNNLALFSSNKKNDGDNFEVLCVKYFDANGFKESIFSGTKEVDTTEREAELIQIKKQQELSIQQIQEVKEQQKAQEQQAKNQENTLLIKSDTAARNINSNKTLKPNETSFEVEKIDVGKDSIPKETNIHQSVNLTDTVITNKKSDTENKKTEIEIAKALQDSIFNAQLAINKKAAKVIFLKDSLENLKLISLKKAAKERFLKDSLENFKLSSLKRAAEEKFKKDSIENLKLISLKREAEEKFKKDSIESLKVSALKKAAEERYRQDSISKSASLILKKAKDEKYKQDSIKLAKESLAQIEVQKAQEEKAIKEKHLSDSIRIALQKQEEIKKKEETARIISEKKEIAERQKREKHLRDSVTQAKKTTNISIESKNIAYQKAREKAIRDSISDIQKINALKDIQEKNLINKERIAIERQKKLRKAIEQARTDSVARVSRNNISQMNKGSKSAIKPEFQLNGYLPSCDTSENTRTDRFTVQVGAGFMKVRYFNKLDDKKICYGKDGLARIIVGSYSSKASAEAIVNEIRNNGFSDAWVPEIDSKRCACDDNDLVKDILGNGSRLPSGMPSYTIQVGAGNMKIKYFANLRQVRICNGPDGILRFIFGEFTTMEDAEKVRAKLVEIGYKDAWIPEIDANRCSTILKK